MTPESEFLVQENLKKEKQEERLQLQVRGQGEGTPPVEVTSVISKNVELNKWLEEVSLRGKVKIVQETGKKAKK